MQVDCSKFKSMFLKLKICWSGLLLSYPSFKSAFGGTFRDYQAFLKITRRVGEQLIVKDGPLIWQPCPPCKIRPFLCHRLSHTHTQGQFEGQTQKVWKTREEKKQGNFVCWLFHFFFAKVQINFPSKLDSVRIKLVFNKSDVFMQERALWKVLLP